VMRSMMTSIQAMTVAAAVANTCGVTDAWNGSLMSAMPIAVFSFSDMLSEVHAGVKRTCVVSVMVVSASRIRTPPDARR
jgi:hypothetical protein